MLSVNVGELRRVVKEGRNEFKPKMYGSDETKRINDKAYSDMEKETKAYNGGLTKRKDGEDSELSYINGKGMHNLVYDTMNDEFKKRTRAQMKGYASADAEEKHSDEPFGNASFKGNTRIEKAAEKQTKEFKDGRDKATTIGLTGRELPKDDVKKLHHTMFESGNRIKRLSFKNTRFVNEEHVLSRVPDELKCEGSRFIMRDSDLTEYLVEWSSKNPKVTRRLNFNMANEEKERIKNLWEYNSREHDSHTNHNVRLNEGNDVKGMLDKVRRLMK